MAWGWKEMRRKRFWFLRGQFGDQKLKPESGESQVFRQGRGEARRGHLRAVGVCITADLNCDSLAHSRYLYVFVE